MVSIRLNKFFHVAFLAGFSVLMAQSPDLLNVYQKHAYYLEKDSRFFTGTYFNAKNPSRKFTVARPGFFSLTIQEYFFQDSPEAMEEISGFKKAARNQMITLGAAILFESAMVPILNWEEADARTWYPPGLSLVGAGLISWAQIESQKAFNHIYMAIHRHNLFALKGRLPAEAYTYFEANCMHRLILPFGGSQIVVNQQPHDVPSFLRPAPSTDQLFAEAGIAGQAYTDFNSQRRKAVYMDASGIGLLFGSIFWAAVAPNEDAFATRLLTGWGGAFALIISGSYVGIAADNHLNRAVYIYNQEVIRGYQ